MLTLGNTVTVPPGGYRYRHAGTAYVTRSPTWPDFLREVQQYRKVNNLPFNGRLAEEIQDQLCHQLPEGWCHDEVNRPYGNRTLKVGLQTVLQGTATLADWFWHGREKVSADTARQRADICAGCLYNVEPEGCTGCNGNALHAIVDRVVGGAQLPNQDRLKACALCGCSLKAKVWIGTDVLQRHISPSVLQDMPDWCWVKPLAL